ncbi:hypothetical protein [Variovorax sp. E3]|uniref:hypothetical protein n=1 Tax=Variovorax sp. E3 TaxID=1914993 RepID=UPI0018DD79D5|nr:hypothetical protein [Variovorax sp. E3]
MPVVLAGADNAVPTDTDICYRAYWRKRYPGDAAPKQVNAFTTRWMSLGAAASSVNCPIRQLQQPRREPTMRSLIRTVWSPPCAPS